MEPLTTPVHIDKYHKDLKDFEKYPVEPDYKALYHFAIGWIEARAWGAVFREALKDMMEQKDK